MITSSVKVLDQGVGALQAEIDRRTVTALNAAAREGARVANERAKTTNGKQVGMFQVIPAAGSWDGFSAGIKSYNPLWRIYDKGTLGKRTAALKKPRRKTTWEVKRAKDAAAYQAQRGDVGGKGIDPAHISNAARTAGRKTLIQVLNHR